MQRLKLSLADANASIARLESGADEARSARFRIWAGKQAAAGVGSGLEREPGVRQQTVDALQKELKSSRDGVTQVEIAYQKLRDQSGGDRRRSRNCSSLPPSCRISTNGVRRT